MTPEPEHPEEFSDLEINGDRWLDLYGSDLYRIACSVVRDPDQAEDLVQETLLSALESRHQLRSSMTEKKWLLGILRHKIVDHLRRESRYRHPDDLVTDDGDSTEIWDFFFVRGKWVSPPSSWSDPEKSLEEKRFWNAFEECLSRLPLPLAHLFVLKNLEDTPTEILCKEFGITPTNLWVRLHRARLVLRGCLEHQWFDPAERRE